MVADVTEQKSIEAQLRQAQKLDAVGQLAGGVAHDFNNLLTVIDGYAVLLLADAGETASRDLTMIRDAAARAGALTRQLLAFSRTQAARPCALDVVGLVANVEGMLRRLIREDIHLVVTAPAAPAPVFVDPGQLEQVLLNLAVNARDAMPSGGTLTISTGRVELGSEAANRLGAQPGPYIMITVADTGCGMSAEVSVRAFEPFFTTKEQGKGSGLGLSTVYGIVSQAGGHIQVWSKPGAGSTFSVYLPATTAAVADADTIGARPGLATGTETILLVEDDPAVRQLTERILRTAGYQVLASADVHDALAVAARRRPHRPADHRRHHARDERPAARRPRDRAPAGPAGHLQFGLHPRRARVGPGRSERGLPGEAVHRQRPRRQGPRRPGCPDGRGDVHDLSRSHADRCEVPPCRWTRWNPVRLDR